jgi:hypothetical protein
LVAVELAVCQILMVVLQLYFVRLPLVAVEAVETPLMDLVGLVDQAVAEMVRVAVQVLVILHLFHHHKVTMVALVKVCQV